MCGNFICKSIGLLLGLTLCCDPEAGVVTGDRCVASRAVAKHPPGVHPEIHGFLEGPRCQRRVSSSC